MDKKEWIKKNKKFLEFLCKKIKLYVDVDFDEFAEFIYHRRDKFH